MPVSSVRMVTEMLACMKEEVREVVRAERLGITHTRDTCTRSGLQHSGLDEQGSQDAPGF